MLNNNSEYLGAMYDLTNSHYSDLTDGLFIIVSKQAEEEVYIIYQLEKMEYLRYSFYKFREDLELNKLNRVA